MRDDENLRGQDSFPLTRWSLILAARSAEPAARQRALAILTAAYWKPVYKYIRLRWDKDNEQAKDLTQEFFFRLLEKNFLASYDPRRARLLVDQGRRWRVHLRRRQFLRLDGRAALVRARGRLGRHP